MTTTQQKAQYIDTFDFAKVTPKELETWTDEAIKKAQVVVDEILGFEGKRTVENTLHRLEEIDDIFIRVENIGLLENVHPDSELQESAQSCVQKIEKFMTEITLNPQLYQAIAQVDISNEDAQTQRYYNKIIREFKRSGADKDEKSRKRLQQLNEQKVRLGQEFDKNTRTTRSIEVDPAELEGLSESYIKAHQPNENGKIVITTDYPDLIPFLTFAKNEDARRRLYVEFTNMAYPENDKILKELIQTLQEITQLLGYDNFVDYDVEEKMTGNAGAVREFLDSVDASTREAAKDEYDKFLALKQEQDPGASFINYWDINLYYPELYKRKYFNSNSQDLLPYFEYDKVKEGILKLTSQLFNLTYTKVEDVPVWHQSVEVYEVVDSATKETLGRFYLDMHPRENKFKHGAHFGFVSGIKDRQLPEAALVCNFPDPQKQENALMEYAQVKTFLHEFGHLLHSTLGGKTKYSMLAGTNVQRDFVEAPSQMLEVFLESVETLQTFATHYKTGEPIPRELVERAIEAERFGKPTWARRQAFLADFSFSVYFNDIKDTEFEQLHRELYDRYFFSPYPKDSKISFWCSFGHLNGYFASYYTYLWSKVIALDLFTGFNQDDLMDSEVAMKYREKVLEPGGTKDADELVEDFLGRPYNFDAFERWLKGQ